MIKETLALVPTSPGCYQMIDAHGNIIYVGKAKNLKNRLTTYFTGSHDYKTTKMIQNIERFEYIVTHTEIEALILEIDLIKKYQPRYNVLLTDDKSYPYIEITQERHPKLIVTRTLNKTNKHLYGPYPNVKAARETLNLLHKLYPLRKCHKLPKQPCLYYYIDQCLAPCIHKVTPHDYHSIQKAIHDFLKGNTTPIIKQLKDKMLDASEKLEFERAQEYKITIEAIQTTTQQQSVTLDDLKDRDLIAITNDAEHIALETFFIRNGKISAHDKKVFAYYLDAESPVLEYCIQFYQNYPLPSEILTNQPHLLDPLKTLFQVELKHPQRGPKRKLLELALLNAKQSLSEATQTLKKQSEKTFGALDELAELLGIPTPYHIEAFDNSHLFGTYPVSSLVVFKNAIPSKKDYRKYKLSTNTPQSGDTDQMKEVLYRRYQRLLYENQKAPDLILVDGGIHQLNAAKAILKELNLTIPLAGIVKSDKHKTSHLIDQTDNAFQLNPHSKLFHLLAQVQEEAHRFAITFHKELRHKGIYSTVLDRIPGVGETTKKKLLHHFKTIEAMKKASYDDFKALKIPNQTILNIQKTLHKGAPDDD